MIAQKTTAGLGLTTSKIGRFKPWTATSRFIIEVSYLIIIYLILSTEKERNFRFGT